MIEEEDATEDTFNYHGVEVLMEEMMEVVGSGINFNLRKLKMSGGVVNSNFFLTLEHVYHRSSCRCYRQR